MRIKFILLALLLTPLIYSQDIDYMKMIDIEIGSSLKDVKNLWETGELKEYGMLKKEQILAREKTSYLKYGNKSKEAIFSRTYSFIEDSLFSITIISRLTLGEASLFVISLEGKYGKLKQEFEWKFQTFEVERINKKDSSINKIGFGIEPGHKKFKISFNITNLRLVEKRKTIMKEFISKNNSLDGFFNIIWESSKEEVIKSMESFEGVRVDSIREYRVDFSGGEFGGVKVSKWIYAFEDDKFYNLLIEFDSKVGSNDFHKVKKLLTFHYGNEANINTVYHLTKNEILKFFNWLYYSNSMEIFAKIILKGCCDVESPKPLRLSYTYIPISRNVLPKRPPDIKCWPGIKNKTKGVKSEINIH
jgi:hypothetical protein